MQAKLGTACIAGAQNTQLVLLFHCWCHQAAVPGGLGPTLRGHIAPLHTPGWGIEVTRAHPQPQLAPNSPESVLSAPSPLRRKHQPLPRCLLSANTQQRGLTMSGWCVLALCEIQMSGPPVDSPFRPAPGEGWALGMLRGTHAIEASPRPRLPSAGPPKQGPHVGKWGGTQPSTPGPWLSWADLDTRESQQVPLPEEGLGEHPGWERGTGFLQT